MVSDRPKSYEQQATVIALSAQKALEASFFVKEFFILI